MIKKKEGDVLLSQLVKNFPKQGKLSVFTVPYETSQTSEIILELDYEKVIDFPELENFKARDVKFVLEAKYEKFNSVKEDKVLKEQFYKKENLKFYGNLMLSQIKTEFTINYNQFSN